MTTLEAIERWRAEGAISAAQHAALTAIVRKDRFSVFLELNSLLYLGVLAFVAGAGWTVYDHFAQLGDAAVVVPLAVAFAACLYYCFSRSRPYQPERVESPSFAFDYVLYLGCLLFALELGYIEFRFHALGERSDFYLLASAILYFILAYRFDNRFVLSLALSTLGAWFGFRLFSIGIHIGGSPRGDAIAYASVAAAIGLAANRAAIKPHFLDTYLHVAANAALAAMASGTASERSGVWTLALLAAAAVAIERGIRFRRFAFVAYGVIYGYWGISAQVLRAVGSPSVMFLYFIVSGLAVIAALVVLSRRVAREE
jgi:hypothetical protein